MLKLFGKRRKNLGQSEWHGLEALEPRVLMSVSVAADPPNHPPVISGFTVSPETVTPTGQVHLTLKQVKDTDGTVAAVEFYRDANNNGVLDVGVDVKLNVQPAGENSWVDSAYTGPVGVNRLFAVAQDDDGAFSKVRSTTLIVLPDPSPLGGLTFSANPIVPGKRLTVEVVAITPPETLSVVFYRDVDGNGIINPAVDQLLGTDTNGADGWSWTGKTSSFPVGVTSIYALPRDATEFIGAPIWDTLLVLPKSDQPLIPHT